MADGDTGAGGDPPDSLVSFIAYSSGEEDGLSGMESEYDLSLERCTGVTGDCSTCLQQFNHMMSDLIIASCSHSEILLFINYLIISII